MKENEEGILEKLGSAALTTASASAGSLGLASVLTGPPEPHSRIQNWPFYWKSEPTSIWFLEKGEEETLAIQSGSC